MADRNYTTTDPDPPLTSVAADDTAAPVDTASTQLSSDLKEAVKDASPVTATVEKGNGETPVEDAANGSDTASAAKKDSEHQSNGAESAEKPKVGAITESKQTTQKDKSAQYSNERSKKRTRESNVKSDLTSQPISSDPVAIRKQVEFYFADSNLPMDQFLFSRVEGHKNLPVPIDTIASFKRMRHFQPFSAVVAALKESEVLDVVDDDTAVKRKIPLPETVVQGKSHQEVSKIYEDKTMSRSVYVKGFGPEKRTTQFDIEAFFAPYGPVNSVRLRRTDDKIFKRSVFVEFGSEDTAQAFLSLDPKPEWEGNSLVIKSKKQYCDEKVDDINTGRIQPNRNPKRPRHNDDDDRSWKDRRDEDAKKGFGRSNGDRGHSNRDRGRGRGGRGGRGSRGGRDDRGGRSGRGGGRQTDNRGVPVVATTEADSVTQAQSAPDTSSTTDGAAAPKGETGTSNASAPDVSTTTNDEAATKVES